MTDLTDHLCNLRRMQNDSPTLLPAPDVEPWIYRANTELKTLKHSYATCGTEQDRDRISDEHECIVTALEDLIQKRADLIWELARDGAGDVDLMTTREADIYAQLVGLAEDLRGETI